MEFVKLNDEEYMGFVASHEQFSFYQLPGWGKLKEANGWRSHLVGMKDGDNVVAATLLLEKNTPIKKKIFYAPRGFIAPYDDFELLKFFVGEVKNYIKINNGFMLKIDPNVIYQIRDKDGNEDINCVKNDLAIDNLRKLGFKHLGFNRAFESMQPRFLCRFLLKDNYEDTLPSFSKTTRKRILELEQLGVQVKKANNDEIKIAVSLLDETASRKGIAKRPSSYYENMKRYLLDYMDIFLCYLEKDHVIEQINNNIKEEEKNINVILEKMKKDMVGKKLTEQMNLAEAKIKKQQELLDFVNSIDENVVYIGSLFSMWTGDEGITLLSGTNDKFRKFLPKYALYNEHIKEALVKKKKYVNFYGISGVFDPNDENYGIYEVKKGFNPEVIELIGEFNLVINPFYYFLYNVSFKIYKTFKNAIK